MGADARSPGRSRIMIDAELLAAPSDLGECQSDAGNPASLFNITLLHLGSAVKAHSAAVPASAATDGAPAALSFPSKTTAGGRV
ncbi:hypothetical protein DY240_04735 [Jiangella rhizosphaerae]|uniref:Uncharacterized protein n=1 Tax=Jiangella rhizosphaerae TaxID=2293569 RepID=A0A418KV07_9ACTN|nr:hypothetical protein DY240_04735 [Jiangella rhizosphaerae]